MNNELTVKLVRKEIEARRNFANKAEDLCAIVQKFDGKIFNKRLETAMREVYPVRIEQEFLWKSISITGYIEDRMVKSDEVDRWGCHPVAYLKDYRIYVGIIHDAFDDNKRIIAENIVKYIRNTAEYYRKSADEIEVQLERIDEIIAECNRIRAEKQKFRHEVNGTLFDYFELEV